MDQDFAISRDPVNANFYFISSKTKTDNLPLSSFRVMNQPCIDPKALEVEKRNYFKLEFWAEVPTCEYNSKLDLIFDDRYSMPKQRFRTSEYSHLDSIGVIDKLAEYYKYSSSRELNKMKKRFLNFWSRPSNSYNLTCESLENGSRQDFISLY